MSAYRSGFIKELVRNPANIASLLKVSPAILNDYEPLMAGDELVITMSGDNIQGLSEVVTLQIVPI